jgi:hypothetical protein
MMTEWTPGSACVCGYSVSHHLARHKRTCKHLRAATERLLREENARLVSRNEALAAQNAELCARLEELRARPVVNTTVNANTVTAVTAVTVVCPYGQEDAPAYDEVGQVLQTLLPSDSVPRYVQMKHFRRPETANIRIPNKRGRTLQVVEQDEMHRRKWVDRDRKEMLFAITNASLDELVERFNAEKYHAWNRWFERSGLKDEGYDKTDAFREIMKKVEHVITSQNPSNAIG